MVSPELLRRFEFFAEFSGDHLKTLVLNATDRWFDKGHRFFRDGEQIDRFYVVVEGKVGITLDAAAAQNIEPSPAYPLLGRPDTEDVVVSTVDRGQVFGWSSLLPPNRSTAGAVVLEPSDIVAMDAKALRSEMERDPAFGFRMAQQLAKVIHGRLQDRRIESIVEAISSTK